MLCLLFSAHGTGGRPPVLHWEYGKPMGNLIVPADDETVWHFKEGDLTTRCSGTIKRWYAAGAVCSRGAAVKVVGGTLGSKTAGGAKVAIKKLAVEGR